MAITIHGTGYLPSVAETAKGIAKSAGFDVIEVSYQGANLHFVVRGKTIHYGQVITVEKHCRNAGLDYADIEFETR